MRLRVAATNEKAKAEKILQIKREGEAESKFGNCPLAPSNCGRVERQCVRLFCKGTSAKDVMDMVLVTQYFDTMKEIGAASKSSVVFIPYGSGAVRDMVTHISDGLLQQMDTDDDPTCSICFDEFLVKSETIRMPCSHMYIKRRATSA